MDLSMVPSELETLGMSGNEDELFKQLAGQLGDLDWAALAAQKYYEVPEDLVPRVFLFWRDPAKYGPDEQDQAGVVAWGLEIPGNRAVAFMPEEGGRTTTVVSESAAQMAARWCSVLKATLMWVPAPEDRVLSTRRSAKRDRRLRPA
jgi:hypothetical protein